MSDSEGSHNEDDTNFDITEILKAVENTENENIMKYTREKIHNMKDDILQQLQFSEEKLADYHGKLKNFRYVDDLSDLNYGSYIRWINISNPERLQLTNGGIICDIQFFDSGVQILCKNPYNKFYQIKFDNCIFFQKLTNQEQVILDVISYLNND